MGVNTGDAGGILVSVLPELINQLAPQDQAPAGGLDNAGALMGMLGILLNQNASVNFAQAKFDQAKYSCK